MLEEFTTLEKKYLSYAWNPKSNKVMSSRKKLTEYIKYHDFPEKFPELDKQNLKEKIENASNSKLDDLVYQLDNFEDFGDITIQF